MERLLGDDNQIASRNEILNPCFQGNLTPQSAAEQLASMTLSSPDVENNLEITWDVILVPVREVPEHHDKLIDVLHHLSRSESAQDENGEQLKVHSMRVWSGLPMLAYEINSEWDGKQRFRSYP